MRNVHALLRQRCRMIAAASALMLVVMSLPVKAAGPPEESGEFIFDTIFVNRGPDKDHISAFKDSNYRNEVKVHEHYIAQNTIQWALDNARVTVITDGQYKISHPITIKKPGTRLVIGPKATIQGTDTLPRRMSVIEVNRANDVQIFVLGTLKGNAGVGVQFNGQSGGDSGIDGGMIFGSGQLKNVRAGYWLVDTANVKIPLAVSENPLYAVTGMEGAHDTEIGTVAQMTSGVYKDGSTVDITMNNKRVNIQHVFGPSPDRKDKVVHVNNSHNVTINQLTAFVGSDGREHSVVLADRYDVPGLMYQLERDRPLFGFRTERPILAENKGLNIQSTNRVRKDVAEFSKEVSYPGFPKSIPELNVKVNLTVEFDDGREAELFKKDYNFNLQK
ncbi:MAG: hypothetical protein V5A84_00750 [Planctomycetota bacterium]